MENLAGNRWIQARVENVDVCGKLGWANDWFAEQAEPDSMDWLHFSQDVQDVMSKYWPTIDTMLMGRKTWDVAVANGSSGGGDVSMSGITTYVFSRTLKTVGGGAHLVSSDPAEFVRQLK